MKNLLIIALCIFSFGQNLIGQIDVHQLIHSKKSNAPTYELYDGTLIKLMGFTSTIGDPITLQAPTLIYNEGDSVELSLYNFTQGAPHTIHLHGLDVNQENDGVPSLSFAVEHGETKQYYFKAPHPGTYIYHCHVISALHVQAGMYGLLIIKPSDGSNTTWDGGITYHNEFAWLMSEVDIDWHHDTIINSPYDPLNMNQLIIDYNPNYFLVNGFSNQQLSNDNNSIISSAANQTTLLRLANIGNYGNRIIFPQNLNAKIISSDGRPLPNPYFSDSIEVMPGERYQVLLSSPVEFVDSVQVEYFNLNTQLISGTEYVPVIISEFNSIITNKINTEIKAYPNPASNILTLELPKPSDNIKIFNLVGEQIFETKGLQTIKIDVSTWSKGVYMIKTIINTETLIKKIIIL